jgi:hypothetical protein
MGAGAPKMLFGCPILIAAQQVTGDFSKSNILIDLRFFAAGL